MCIACPEARGLRWCLEGWKPHLGDFERSIFLSAEEIQALYILCFLQMP